MKEFVATLMPMSPRLYSISSSPKAYPDEVHLTVGVVEYELAGRKRKGVASTYLGQRVHQHQPVRVFVQPSHGFAPPADPSVPMIMVGPGTGIAPFRAFLQDRKADGATGKNWLFFGDQHEATDFLYRDELEQFVADGFLHQLSTAFSRDSDQKVYVQNRMLEHAAELWQWLSEGGHFYVCGDAKRMAKDVDAALHTIVAQQGSMNEEDARAFVKQMSENGRYQRDVY
jgi:sulfite reductase (NADPH) flavoprotein alpha-component